ncbi:hypothetical protein JOM56_003183 [Amanita muscaria]
MPFYTTGSGKGFRWELDGCDLSTWAAECVVVWIFFILANANTYAADTTTITEVDIILDGNYIGSFSHKPDTNIGLGRLANTSHKLIIWNGIYNYRYLNFDWAIYTADINTPASHSASGAFTSTTDSSSIVSTSSPTATPQRLSSKIGVIVGRTLRGLAVITPVLAFLVCRLRRAPPVRNGNIEGILDIDVPPHFNARATNGFVATADRLMRPLAMSATL